MIVRTLIYCFPACLNLYKNYQNKILKVMMYSFFKLFVTSLILLTIWITVKFVVELGLTLAAEVILVCLNLRTYRGEIFVNNIWLLVTWFIIICMGTDKGRNLNLTRIARKSMNTIIIDSQ